MSESSVMKICSHNLLVILLGVFVLGETGCKSPYASANRPLQEERVALGNGGGLTNLPANRPLQAGRLAPDCRATFEIQQPRGEKDVLVILCLSGGGSRAAWFSAATMLRLEKVVDGINLLHEVDVISSVSGGRPARGLLLRQPRSGALFGRPSGATAREAPGRIDGSRENGSAARPAGCQRQNESGTAEPVCCRCLPVPHDQECVERLYWLSNHTHAPEVWQPDRVRALMTRNYTEQLLRASFSPLNFWDDWLYWTTAYNRSDQMAKIFTEQYLRGQIRAGAHKLVPTVTNLQFLGYLDQPVQAAHPDTRGIRGG